MKSLMIFCCTFFLCTGLSAQYTASIEMTDIATESSAIPAKTDNSILLFTLAEEYPKFPGGEEEMFRFIQEHVEYPEIARSHGHEGTVVVQFVVETDGSVDQIKILRPVGLGCDEAALAVFEKMPKWRPAYQSGRAVPVRYITPVKFSLF